MKTFLLAICVVVFGSVAACASDPACTGEESQMCTDQFTACTSGCTDAACMNDCARADCDCHAMYGCPPPPVSCP